LARTIEQLAKRQAELVAELSEIRAEIATRAGEADQPAKAKRTRTKAV
jgi:ribosomal protein L29